MNHMSDISSELKPLEAKAAEIEKKKADLLRKQEEEERKLQKLDEIVATSGYANARQLVDALMARFKISPSQVGRKSGGGKRSRTTVTASLRDAIRSDLASGMSKTGVGEKHGVSYLVVRGVETGKYDNLS